MPKYQQTRREMMKLAAAFMAGLALPTVPQLVRPGECSAKGMIPIVVIIREGFYPRAWDARNDTPAGWSHRSSAVAFPAEVAGMLIEATDRRCMPRGPFPAEGRLTTSVFTWLRGIPA